MSQAYVYPVNATDCSTIGLCGALMATRIEYECAAYDFGEIVIEHPCDEWGKWTNLVDGAIVKACVPVRNVPAMDGTQYVTTVRNYWVKFEATYAQRGIWNGDEGNTRLGTAGVYQPVTVYQEGEARYKVYYPLSKITGWIDKEALTYGDDVTIPATREGIEKAAPSFTVKPQLFRIYKVEPKMDRDGVTTVTARARHIVYDLLGNLSSYHTETWVTAQNALNGLFAQANYPHGFTIHTDINMQVVGFNAWEKNIVEALVDPDEGACAKFSGEVIADNYDIYLLHRCGIDSGVTLAYRKNLSGLTVTTDSSNVTLAIKPYGENKNGTHLYLDGSYRNGHWYYNGTEWELPSGYEFLNYRDEQGGVHILDNATIVSTAYPHLGMGRPKQAGLTVTDAVVDNNQVTLSDARRMMVMAAVHEFEAGCAIPEVGIQAEFVLMGDTEEYRQFRHLERMFVYDTVHIKHHPLGISADVSMVNAVWDCLADRMLKAEFGSLMDSTATITSSQISSISGGKIIPQSVGAGAMADGVVAARHMQADSIATESLQADSVTAVKINAQSLSAAAGTFTELQAAFAKLASAYIGTLTAEQLLTDAITAQIARVSNAAIDVANISYAKIVDAEIQNLIAHDAITDRYYIEKLQVLNAQLAFATVGKLVVKADDGDYYQLEIDADGGLYTVPYEPTETELETGETADGRGAIIETDLTVEDLGAQNLKAMNALIDKLSASRLDIQELFARSAFIAALTTDAIFTDGESLSIKAQRADNLADTIGKWFEFDPETGFTIHAVYEDGGEMKTSKWITRQDNESYNIINTGTDETVFRAKRDMVEPRNIQLVQRGSSNSPVRCRASSKGGWIWVRGVSE